MARAVAINVGANTQLPGFRGPIYSDGSFTYVPIPEREPVREPVPTYADLDLPIDIPAEVRDRQVHLDPEFRGYPHCVTHTYGDEHGIKAGPIADLTAGDYLLFYATLSTDGDPDRDWITPDWGAYLIGHFTLAADPLVPDGNRETAIAAGFENNAHVKRETFDAAVLAKGDPASSGLYDHAVPLSSPDAGATANDIVTTLAGDSGNGPWWRRVLRFDPDATASLLDRVDDYQP